MKLKKHIFNFRIPDLEAEQTESLIGISSGEHEA